MIEDAIDDIEIKLTREQLEDAIECIEFRMEDAIDRGLTRIAAHYENLADNLRQQGRIPK